jgi:hypothetical protein
MCIFVDMANVDEPIYLACRRALVGLFDTCVAFVIIWFYIQGLDGSSEISGLLSNVQDIEALTDHVINVVRTKMREQSSIRVKLKYNLNVYLFIKCFSFVGCDHICSAICRIIYGFNQCTSNVYNQ